MPFATSIMVAGCYKDDQDDGHELWYTGTSRPVDMSDFVSAAEPRWAARFDMRPYSSPAAHVMDCTASREVVR